MTIKAVLMRTEQSNQGTFGTLVVTRPDGSSIKVCTAERNWHDNTKSISCIPVGTYQCVIYNSQTKGRRYLVKQVLNRGGILIHAGNYVGDPPLKADSQGCILVGLGFGRDPRTGQHMVLSSRKALEAFETFCNNQPFELDIRNFENAV